MKTKLLPAVIGSVLALGSTVAAAELTLFGHIDTSINAVDVDVDVDHPDFDPETDGKGYDDINFKCTTCSIGFKGSEDLGNGLKAIFSLDFQYDVFSRDSTSLTDRDQWLGLAGNFGKVRFGTISTPYKSHGAMIDPLYRTSLQGRDGGLQSDFHNGAGENLEGRAEYTMRYDSPSWNGLKVAAFYTLDSNESDGFGGTEDNDPYGLGVSYENGGILAFADYQDNNGSSSDVGGDITAWKVGGKYTSKMFGVMGQYESSEADEASAAQTVDVETTVWHVGAHGTLFGITGYLGYGQGEADVSGGSTQDYSAWTLALMYDMSKRTKVYLGHTQADCDRLAGEYFSACESGDTQADGEIDQFSVGMKHKF